MARIVTNLAGSAALIDNNTIGSADDHTNWSNLGNVPTSDNLYAVADFADGTGDQYSNYLHLKDFGFSVDEFAVIDGIELSIEKRSVGSVSDFQVRVTYGETPDFTFPQNNGTWPSTDTNDTYGGSSDIWNRSWSPSEINGENFGIAIAAEGTLGSSAAFVDTASITIHYHIGFDEEGLGGSTTGGTADVDVVYATQGIGGSVAGGHAGLIFEDIATGGLVAGGSGSVVEFVSSQGGVVASGSATLSILYIDTPSGGVSTGGTGDPDFEDIISVSGGVVIGGSAPVTSGYFGIGGVEILPSVEFDFTYNTESNGGIVIGGSSFADPYIATGGSLLGGEAVDNVIYPEIGSGGSLAGGSSPITEVADGNGGIQVGGTSPPYFTIDIPDYTFLADGTQQGTDSTASATLQFWIARQKRTEGPNAGFYQASWRIEYSGISDEDITEVDLHFASPGSDSFAAISLLGNSIKPIGDYSSPLIGQYLLDDADFDQVRNEDWYILFSTNDSPTGLIRGQAYSQITNLSTDGSAVLDPIFAEGGLTTGGSAFVDPYISVGGVSVGGSASVSSTEPREIGGGVVVGGTTEPSVTLKEEVASGGVVVGGTAVYEVLKIPPASGGVVVGGTSVSSNLLRISGGANVGGTADVSTTFNTFGSEGVVTQGDAVDGGTFDPNISGGIQLSGRAAVSIEPAIGGGVVIAGTSSLTLNYVPAATGGVVIGGIHLQQFTDFVDGIGGVTVAPKSRYERLRELTTVKVFGVGQSLATPNLRTFIEDEGFIVEDAEIADEVRQEEQPTWCNILGSPTRLEDECDAGVPDIVIENQKPYVPEKVRPEKVAF